MELFTLSKRMKGMTRPSRQHYSGAIYHVMARGNGGQDIFHDNEDRERLLELLIRLKVREGFEIFAFCLMSNHFHLLLRVGDAPLSTIMQSMLTAYSKLFNAKWKREGHVFYERYKAIHCRDDSYLATLVRYIHLNPVKAGMVSHPANWPWSSHRVYLGEPQAAVNANFVLAVLGGISGYREFIEQTPDQDVAPEHVFFPDDEVSSQSRTPLDSLARTSITKRDLILAALEAGYGAVEIAQYLDCTPQAVSNAKRRARVTSKPVTDVTLSL